MAPDADATAGPPQGGHDLEAVLAEEPVARLLAAYLDQLLRHLLLQAPTSASSSPKLAKAELRGRRRRDLGVATQACRSLAHAARFRSRAGLLLGGRSEPARSVMYATAGAGMAAWS